jgi:hypothetical protein
MRIISRQPRIDRPLPPQRAARERAGNRSLARRLARMLIGLALSALVAHTAAAKKEESSEKPDTQSWYAETFAHSDTGLNVTHLWALKSRFRAETVIRGHKLVTIVSGDTYYAYDALTMTGIAVRRAPAAIAEESRNLRPFGNEAQILIDDGGEKIREQTIAGKRADVYQVTDDNGRRIVWVTQDDRRLPIRIEVFNRKSGLTRYKEYVDWVSGLPLTDAFFEPAPGVQFERLELDAYIAKTLANDPATAIPILYGELLHGRGPR